MKLFLSTSNKIRLFSILLFYRNLHFSTSNDDRPTFDQIETASKVSICRAHCFDAFAHRFQNGADRPTDAQCRLDTDCFMCWENCEMFQRNFDVWGSICEDTVVCFEGCQLACSVHKKFRENAFPLMHTDPWSFPGPMLLRRNPDAGYMVLQWPQPLPVYSTEPPLPRVVFVVFWLSANGWIQINQTVSTLWTTKNSDLVVDRSPHVTVLATTRDGVVGRLTFPPTTSMTSTVEEKSVFQRDASTVANNIRVETRRTSDNGERRVDFVIPLIAGFVTLVLLLVGAVAGRRFLADKQRRRFLLKRMNGVKIKRSRRPLAATAKKGGKNNGLSLNRSRSDDDSNGGFVACIFRNEFSNSTSPISYNIAEKKCGEESFRSKSSEIILDVGSLEKIDKILRPPTATLDCVQISVDDDEVQYVNCEEFRRKLREQKSIAV